MLNEYPNYKRNVVYYPNNSRKMCNHYLDLFKNLISQREIILKRRNLFRSPLLLIKSLIFLLMQLINIVRFIKKNVLRKFV